MRTADWARPADTSLEAWDLQRRLMASLSGEERVRRAFEASDDLFEVSAAGVRARHPDYTERQVFLAVARLTHGDVLTGLAWPDDELVDA